MRIVFINMPRTDSRIRRRHLPVLVWTHRMRFVPRVSFPRRRFRQRLRAFLWVNRSRVAVLSSGFLLVGFLMSRFFDGYFLGLLHGLLASAVPGMVLLVFLAFTGSIWQLAGAWGEDNTRDELKRQRSAVTFGVS